VPLPRLDLRHGGRVFKNKPAPDNLEVPPHVPADTKLLIGEDKKA
jgi:ubiquinol-cytochrome c reductase iron-sulfur subunit